MKLPVLVVAVFLFTIGVIRSRLPNNLTPVPTPNVLSEYTQSGTSSPAPQVEPTLTPLPSGSPSKMVEQKWQYPGSTIKTDSSGKTSYQSTDDATKITEWYKEKIKTSGMNVKTAVQTKTNGKIKNVLSGAGNGEVEIEITKESTDSIVYIQIQIRD